MNNLTKTLIVGLPLIVLSACGGDDAADRLDIADSVVRFVHASPLAPNLTLYRNDVGRADVNNVAYKTVSNYSFVDSGSAQWQARTAVSNVVLGNTTFDSSRGNRYTIVAFPSTNPDTSLYTIRDPYNKSVTSDKARLRIVNGAVNANSIDLYITSPGADISAPGVTPSIPNTSYKTAGPASGNDSLEIDGGIYQISITAAGSKTILFKGLLSVEKNKDMLLMTLPDSILPAAVKTLIKVDGDAGARELPAS
jgi:hypothetical protein